jgi:hypothetical protein
LGWLKGGGVGGGGGGGGVPSAAEAKGKLTVCRIKNKFSFAQENVVRLAKHFGC